MSTTNCNTPTPEVSTPISIVAVPQDYEIHFTNETTVEALFNLIKDMVKFVSALDEPYERDIKDFVEDTKNLSAILTFARKKIKLVKKETD